MDIESAKLLGLVIRGAKTVSERIALAREIAAMPNVPDPTPGQRATLLQEAQETIDIMTELLESAHKELLKEAPTCGAIAFEFTTTCNGTHTCERPAGHEGMHFRARECECNRAVWSVSDYRQVPTPESPSGTQR